MYYVGGSFLYFRMFIVSVNYTVHYGSVLVLVNVHYVHIS